MNPSTMEVYECECDRCGERFVALFKQEAVCELCDRIHREKGWPLPEIKAAVEVMAASASPRLFQRPKPFQIREGAGKASLPKKQKPTWPGRKSKRRNRGKR